MKKAMFTISALAVAGFMFSGCDETVNADACNDLCSGLLNVCYVNPANSLQGRCGAKCDVGLSYDYAQAACIKATVGGCKGDNDCELTQKCDMDTKVCVPKDAKREYKFVRVDDLSTVKPEDQATREDPGADIDAIVLKKAVGGASHYAVKVLGYQRGDGQGAEKIKAYDPEAALDAPDSFTSYPTDNKRCQYFVGAPADGKYSFVSLAGKPDSGKKGGYLIVEMGGVIEADDTLDVLELGGCTVFNTKDGKESKAIAEEIQVSIAIAAEETGDWVMLNKGTGVVSSTIKATDLK